MTSSYDVIGLTMKQQQIKTFQTAHQK